MQVKNEMEAIKSLNKKIVGIIESGSNANGSYIKFVDGTLLQYGVYDTGSTELNKEYGSVFYDNKVHTFNFPLSFIDNNVSVTSTLELKGGIGGVSLSDFNINSMSYYIFSTLSRNFRETAKIHWQAIGRWK